jgi:hypothetical protein
LDADANKPLNLGTVFGMLMPPKGLARKMKYLRMILKNTGENACGITLTFSFGKKLWG